MIIHKHKPSRLLLLPICLLLISSTVSATTLENSVGKGEGNAATIQVFCRNRVSSKKERTIALDVNHSDTVISAKEKLYAKTGIPVGEQRLTFSGKTLANAHTLKQCNIRQSSTVNLSLLLLGGGGGNLFLTSDKTLKRLLGEYNRGEGIDDIPITTYHVSCKSYRPKKLGGELLAGIVLYAYDREIDWYLNGIHCRAGYVILKRSKDIQHIKTTHQSQVHGKVYKSVFGVDLDPKKVVGSGFSYTGSAWKFNSLSLNAYISNGFHDSNRSMHRIETHLITQSMENWVTKGIQNTDAVVSEELRRSLNGLGNCVCLVGNRTIEIKKKEKKRKRDNKQETLSTRSRNNN